MATATSAVTFDNLLCFPAMRRQATGIGIDLVSNVVLSIGEYPLAFTLRYKGVLVAHASASSLARVVGVEASHVRLEFVGERLGSWDLTLTTVAESDLLEVRGAIGASALHSAHRLTLCSRNAQVHLRGAAASVRHQRGHTPSGAERQVRGSLWRRWPSAQARRCAHPLSSLLPCANVVEPSHRPAAQE